MATTNFVSRFIELKNITKPTKKQISLVNEKSHSKTFNRTAGTTNVFLQVLLQPPFRGNFLDSRRVKDQLSKKQVWSPIPLDNVGTTGTLNAPFQTLGSLYEHGPLGVVLYTIS